VLFYNTVSQNFTDDRQLGEIDVNYSTRTGHSHQLSIIRPLNTIKCSFIIKSHNGIHLLQVLKVMDTHTNNTQIVKVRLRCLPYNNKYKLTPKNSVLDQLYKNLNYCITHYYKNKN